MMVRVFICALVSFSPCVYPLHRSMPLLSFSTLLDGEVEQDVLSPKSLGIELVRVCRSRTLQGADQVDAVKSLLCKDIDLEVCDKQGTALMWASFFGLLDIVNILLQRRASLSTTSDLGYKPLHAAAQSGFKHIAEVLMNNGASLDARAHCGSTPLHLAAQEGWDDVVVYLLGLGARVDLLDIQGRTPLHLAAWKGHTRVVALLIDAKACVNAKALGGFTPLHAAVFGLNQEVIEILCSAQADMSLNTDAGESITTAARQRGNDDMMRYLELLFNRLEDKEMNQT